MKKNLVFTTREVVERDRVLTEKETEQVLKRAREIFKGGMYDDFYFAFEEAFDELIEDNYQGIVSAPQLLDTDADGEEVVSLSIKVENSGYFPIREFRNKNEV